MTDELAPHSALRTPNSALSDVAVCRDLITRGSKSFSLAARLFDAERRDDAFVLYGWCRTCDDAIDGSELGFKAGDAPKELPVAEAIRRLDDLKARTRAAFAGRPGDDPVFRAFSEMVRRRRIPEFYAVELLEGMAMDVRRQRYETLDDLLLYCYRVAGTVGLMMSHVMGLRGEAALKNAADLGMAMQLTNIARDVAEDFASDRVYLPLAWLRELGVDAGELMKPERRAAVAAVVKRMLAAAETLYRSGDDGLFALPFRAACAVGAARRVYAEIGRLVESRGEDAWRERAVVPAPRKIFLLVSGIASTLAQAPSRALRPWKPATIKTVWNPFARSVPKTEWEVIR